MEKLKQNNLEESTTGIGFVRALNANAEELSTTTEVALQKEVVLENGETVIVEGITPHQMKAVLNEQIVAANADAEEVSFKTPGEKVEELNGVVQMYNEALETLTTVVEEEVEPAALLEEDEETTLEDETTLEYETNSENETTSEDENV